MTNTMNPTQTYEGELLKVGTTEQREAMESGIEIPVGWMFFDTDLGMPLWWNGSLGGFRRADNTAAGGIA